VSQRGIALCRSAALRAHFVHRGLCKFCVGERNFPFLELRFLVGSTPYEISNVYCHGASWHARC
jgi:hypothetical protein